MKRFLLVLICIMCLPVCSFAQREILPSIIILPSDNWCTQRYFMNSDNVPDYAAAFREDSELNQVVGRIGALMAQSGYNVKDAAREMSRLASEEAEVTLLSSAEGDAIQESLYDILTRTVKADIIIQISWSLNKERKGKSVTFSMDAFDAYTNKLIASSSGTGKPSNEIVPILLEESVKSNFGPFDAQVKNYFRRMETNGREIVLTIRKWEIWPDNLSTDYNGAELLDHIAQWLGDNTIDGRYSLISATENTARFEQIYIPLRDKYGRSLDAYSFTTALQKYLLSDKFSILSRVVPKGVGEAVLILGDK